MRRDFPEGAMIKADIVDLVVDLAKIPRAKAATAVETVIESMRSALGAGGRIALRGFGGFQVKRRKRGIGRSPKTGVEGTRLPRIKEPIRDKRALLEIGAAGPLAGFFTALPFLLYGVTRAKPNLQPLAPGSVLFQYPILVRFAQDLTGAGRYTSTTVQEHPAFMAA